MSKETFKKRIEKGLPRKRSAADRVEFIMDALECDILQEGVKPTHMTPSLPAFISRFKRRMAAYFCSSKTANRIIDIFEEEVSKLEDESHVVISQDTKKRYWVEIKNPGMAPVNHYPGPYVARIPSDVDQTISVKVGSVSWAYNLCDIKIVGSFDEVTTVTRTNEKYPDPISAKTELLKQMKNDFLKSLEELEKLYI